MHGSADGQPESSVSHAQWDFTVEPQFGWGDPGGKQKATAGWLAALPVFEPHWQVRLCCAGCCRADLAQSLVVCMGNLVCRLSPQQDVLHAHLWLPCRIV